MLVDCDTCEVRGPACADCVITVLLGPPPELQLDAEERAALDVLAGSGLVPPLRLVAPEVSVPEEREVPGSRPHEADRRATGT